MRILITRPEPGASRTAAALEAMGHEAVAAPLFSIVPGQAPRPHGRFAALVVTSGNGAEGLTPEAADLSADLPVFAVGDRTAEAMRANGFTAVTSASGDQRTLTRLVLGKLKPRYRVLLATGEDHKEALPAAFAEAGHEIALWLRYRAEPVEALPANAAAALAEGRIDAVLHYSRRASETFLKLAGDSGVAIERLRHLCLSADVAEPLVEAGAEAIAIASQPDEAHLMALLDEAGGLPAGGAMGKGASGTEQAGGAMARPTDEADDKAAGREPGAAPAPAGRTRASSRKTVPSVVVKPADAAAAPAVETAAEATPIVEAPPGEPSAPAPFTAEVDKAAAESPTRETAAPEQPPAIAPSQPEAAAIAASAPEPSPPLAQPPRRQDERAPEPAQRGGIGWGGLLAACLVAGLIGAGLSLYLPTLLAPLGLRAPASPAVAALGDRVARLEAPRPAAEPQVPQAVQSALQAATAQAAQTRQQVEALERRLAEVAARPAGTGNSGASPEAVAELRQKLGEAERASQAANEAVQGITPRLAAVEKAASAAADPSAPATGAARLILADRLQRAIANGRPFRSEAAALGSIGAAPEALGKLSGMAEQGAPSTAALQAAFRAARPAMIAEPAKPDASWTEWLLRLTDGLVRVRATGEVEGTSPAALAARIDQALQRGDTGAAASAWAQLPEPARRATESFGAQLRQRADADRAVTSIIEEATRALAGNT